MAALPYPRSHLLRSKQIIGKIGSVKLSQSKKHGNKVDIDHWRKQVEKASEFAMSEVFFPKRAKTGSKRLAAALSSWEQMNDHDEAYTEAQALLGDWLDVTWNPELEMGGMTSEKGSPATPPPAPTPDFNYDNFNDLYDHLVEEEEHHAVNNFLQDLKEQKVLPGRMVEKLALDGIRTNRNFADPVVTMELRHQQVRENRASAEDAKKKREMELEEKKRVEAKKRQHEMVRQEIVRMRRQREERKGLEMRLRQRERLEGQDSALTLQPPSPPPTMQPTAEEKTERPQKNKVELFVHLRNLKCLQRHFARWYSAVMEQRLRMGKAKALYDWRRLLQGWRAWRTILWAKRNQREVSKTGEDLRTENRQLHLAEESDRKRLLGRCFREWQLWCRQEREERELLAQQEETRRKMDALISAAMTGVFKPPETPARDLPESAAKDNPKKASKMRYRPTTVAVRVRSRHCKETQTAAEDRQIDDDADRGEGGVESSEAKSTYGSCFKNRNEAQKKIIMKQKQRLKEQQEEIARLKREKVMATMVTPQPSATTEAGQPEGSPRQNPLAPPTCPIISAMEERARFRAERKKQTEELKKVKEEEKKAEEKAAEAKKLKMEELEKAQLTKERKLARMREDEKLRQMKLQQQLYDRARQHYDRKLLRHRGLAQWKRLMELAKINAELAESHHSNTLQWRCLQRWRRTARKASSKKEACADRLHHRHLLRQSLRYWKKLGELRLLQEAQAHVFCRAHMQRRFLLALLDHARQQKRLESEHQSLAQEHDNRAALRRCLRAWKLLPLVQRKEREREERRERLCRKVTEVLPSFWSRRL
ncbi:coiled-coil domain-containing protein 191 [Stigmatopora argus]